jgi:hypothetical protein
MGKYWGTTPQTIADSRLGVVSPVCGLGEGLISPRRKETTLLRYVTQDVCTKYYFSAQIEENGMSGARRRHGRGEKCIQNLKEIDHLEDKGADGRIILEWILGKWDGKLCSEFIWLKIGTSGGLL